MVAYRHFANPPRARRFEINMCESQRVRCGTFRAIQRKYRAKVSSVLGGRVSHRILSMAQKLGVQAGEDVYKLAVQRSCRNGLHELYPAIAVCVFGPCYDPWRLRRTLEAVIEQDYLGRIILMIPDVGGPDPEWVRSHADGSRIIITAPCAGTSLALDCNTTLEVAVGLQPAVKFVALLSCGGRPPKNWLSSVMAAQDEFDADFVIGPVKAVFDESPPDWMVAGGFFDRCGIRRGPIRRLPAADNLLMRAEIVRSCLPQVFSKADPEEIEWMDFAYRMEALGSVSIWANEAVVFNAVPKSRMNEEWIINSEHTKAYATARAQSRYQAGRLGGAFRRLRAFGLLLAGGVLYGIGRIARSSALRARLMLARARGAIAACSSHEPYEREAA
jgi:hypothetical protein